MSKNSQQKARRKKDKDRARRLQPYLTDFLDQYGPRKKLPRVRKKKVK